ncbi:unnamed protein product, partial [Adineta steineri]
MTIHVVGVDVGGTNTDAVLLRIDSDHVPKVITSTKMVTSSDVFSGMLNAVQQVIKGVDVTAI